MSLIRWAFSVDRARRDVLKTRTSTKHYKHYNAQSCKTRILKFENPCFSYYGIPFLYEITGGKMNKTGRHNEVNSRVQQFSERAPVLRHGTFSSHFNSLPVTVRKLPVQWAVTKTYSHCVRSHKPLYIYIYTHTHAAIKPPGGKHGQHMHYQHKSETQDLK